MYSSNREVPPEDAIINAPTAEDCRAMRERLQPTWRLVRRPDPGDLALYAKVEPHLQPVLEPLTRGKLAAIARSTGLVTGEIYRAAKARVVAMLDAGLPDGIKQVNDACM